MQKVLSVGLLFLFAATFFALLHLGEPPPTPSKMKLLGEKLLELDARVNPPKNHISEFNPGDTVFRRLDGKKMIVKSKIMENNRFIYTCSYITDTNEFGERDFSLAELSSFVLTDGQYGESGLEKLIKPLDQKN